MVVGIIAVVAVIAVVVVTSGKKSKKKEAWVSDELTADSNVPDQASKKKVVQRSPPPEISDEIISTARELVANLDADREKGNALYDEGMAAKDKDPDLWQAKLREAKDHFLKIRDAWNEIEGLIEAELPMGTDWGADEVANHWLGKEAEKVNKAIERLAYLKKQLRMN